MTALIFIGWVVIGAIGGVVVTAACMWGWVTRRTIALNKDASALEEERDELERERYDFSVALDAERAEIVAEWQRLADALAGDQPMPAPAKVLSARGRHYAGHATVTGEYRTQYNERAFANLNEHTEPLHLAGAR